MVTAPEESIPTKEEENEEIDNEEEEEDAQAAPGTNGSSNLVFHLQVIE